MLKKFGLLAIVVVAFMILLSGCKAKRSGFRADNAPVEAAQQVL